MKKFLSLVLILTLGVAIISCSANVNETEESVIKDEDVVAEETTKPTNTPKPTATLTPTPVPPVSEATKPEIDEVETIDFVFRENNVIGSDYYLSAQYIEITSSDYENLANKINEISDSYMNTVYDSEYYQIYFMSINRADSIAFSYKVNNGHNEALFNNIEPLTGNTIILQDVAKDNDDFKDFLVDYLEANKGDSSFKSSWEESVRRAYDEGNIDFTFYNGGIRIYMSPLVLYSYDSTTPEEYQIPYYGNEEHFDSYYLRTPEDYFLVPTSDNEFYIDLDGDGEDNLITYEGTSSDYESLDVLFVVDGNETPFHVDFYDYGTSVLVHRNGENYIYLSTQGDSDSSCLFVYKIVGDSVVYVGEQNGWVEYAANPDNFYVGNSCQALSFCGTLRHATVGSNGMPEAERYYRLRSYNYLTSLVDLSGDLVDENGNSLGVTITIEAGTNFIHYLTDNSTFVVFACEVDGETIYVKFDVDLTYHDGGQHIEGMLDVECFDGIFFAG